MSRILFVLGLTCAAPLVAHAATSCKSRCAEVARSCKVDCSVTHAIGSGRHDCKKTCVSREHTCRGACY
jgi:hypothetical protein